MKTHLNDNPKLNFTMPPFSAGNYASLWSNTRIQKTWKRENLCSRTHELLFLSAIHSLPIPDGAHINVIRSLPYDWYDEADKVAEHFTRKNWHIRSKERTLTFHSVCHCGRQGALALINNAFGWNGIENEQALQDSLLLGIGGNTTEIIRCKNQRFSNASASPNQLGSWYAANILKGLLWHSDIDVSENGAMEILLDRDCYYKGSHDVNEQVDVALSALADRIVREVKNTVDLAKVPYILLSGGGSLLLSEMLAKRLQHDNIQISDDPLFDDCLGGLKSIAGHTTKNVFPVSIDIGARNTKSATLVDGEIYTVISPSHTAESILADEVNV
jgi:hypothetical protein